MIITFVCKRCGHKVIYHTDTIKTKPPEQCYRCKGKRFRKE